MVNFMFWSRVVESSSSSSSDEDLNLMVPFLAGFMLLFNL